MDRISKLYGIVLCTTVFLLAGMLAGCAMTAPATRGVGAASRPAPKKKELSEAQKAALRAQVEDCLPPAGVNPANDVAPLYAQLAEEGNHSAVSLCYQIAIQALQAQRPDEAARVLDGAIKRLEASSAGEKSAKKARSKFHGEEEKYFRGEPYEQAMVYLLRGLLYMQAGDYENARAVFRSGALRDRSSLDAPKEQEYKDDLAEMDYLEGLCNIRLKDPNAAENLKFARQHARAESAAIEPPSNFNTVLVFLSGAGPSKYRTGQYRQFLRFSPGNGAHGPLRMKVDGKEVAQVTGPLDSMTFQATTRGGREIDAVLKGKAQFKTGASIAGDLLVATGVAAGLAGLSDNNTGAQAAGAGLLVVGLIAKAASQAANPEADARMLAPVPDDIYIIPLELSGTSAEVQCECLETGVVSQHTLTRSEKACDIVLVWDPVFGTGVEAARRSKLADLVAQRREPWLERWLGTCKVGDVETPIAILVIAKNEGSFSGILQRNLPDGPEYCPCRGTADEKGFRLEFRDTLLLGSTDFYNLWTGKNSGGKSKGQVYQISGGGMAPLGSYAVALEK